MDELPAWRDIQPPQLPANYIHGKSHKCYLNTSFHRTMEALNCQPIDFRAGNESFLDHIVWNALERISETCRHASENLYVNSQRELYFAILDDSELNAFALSVPDDEEEGFDFIAVNVGALISFLVAFYALLSHPENFPSVGSPDLESIDRLRDFVLTSKPMAILQLPVIPNCEVRSLYAGTLFSGAITFLVAHEITHLLNGHCELNSNYSRICESNSFRAGQEEANLISQTLEWDADSGAVMIALDEFYRLSALIKTNEPSNNNKSILEATKLSLGDECQTIVTALYPAYVIWYLLDQSDWSLELQKQVSHPLPTIRMIYIIETSGLMFQTYSHFNCSNDKFRERILPVLIRADIDLSRLRQEEFVKHKLQDLFSEPAGFQQYHATLVAKWEVLRPVLDKHKRGKSLPN